MSIIKNILTTPELIESPPVLIDIGASEEINKKWKKIAPYSICLAFDADDRDFQVTEKSDSGFKKLITFNRIVTAEAQHATRFYLTNSPYCSSLLKPASDKLQPWLFSDLFNIYKETSLSSITIEAALQSAGVSYIDWFKTDTQGTDLRLFRTLPPAIRQHILAAEFEPGIIDAYEGEDKLYSVMSEMHQNDFWTSSMIVKGTQRFNKKYIAETGLSTIKRTVRTSPGWAEVTYLRQPLTANKRQLLLLIVFGLIEKQYGFALEVADCGSAHFPDGSFDQWKREILSRIKNEKWKIPLVIAKRQFNKLLSGIHD